MSHRRPPAKRGGISREYASIPVICLAPHQNKQEGVFYEDDCYYLVYLHHHSKVCLFLRKIYSRIFYVDNDDYNNDNNQNYKDNNFNSYDYKVNYDNDDNNNDKK